MLINQFLHGYKKGHQLLAGSTQLDTESLELITRLSDLSGSMVSSSEIYPYLTFYPLPNQKYYALAKTWLDTKAQRTGCVLTHTLIIPIDFWSNCTNPFGFHNFLIQPVDSQDLDGYRKSLEIELSPANRMNFSDTSVNPTLLNQFVHRFFGEGISPIIWFDQENPEAILWKLIDSFWPNLRSKFACCTLCLQPRFLGEKTFDLMFAPSAAYTRFHQISRNSILDYPGFKHSTNQEKFIEEPWVNKWTNYLISNSVESNLYNEIAELGPLLTSDPTAIKKIFLIQELRERSKTSAMAAVGLMDIIESLAPDENTAQLYKESTLSAAIQLISYSNKQNDVLKSLVLISDRLKHNSYKTTFQKINRKFYEVVAKYVNENPVEALMLAEQFFNTTTEISTSIFIRGLITGLLNSGEKEPRQLIILHKFPNISPILIDIEPKLSLFFLEAYKSSNQLTSGLSDLTSWISRISNFETRKNLRKILLPEVHNDSYILLLNELLEQISEDDISWILDTLFSSTNGFESVEILNTLCSVVSAAFPDHTREWSYQTSVWSLGVAKLIAATYSMNLDGIKELFETQQLDYRKKGQIMAVFISKIAPNHLPQWLINFIQSNPNLLRLLLDNNDVLLEDNSKIIEKIFVEVPELPLASMYDISEIDRAISANSSLSTKLISYLMRSAVSEYFTGNIDSKIYQEWESTSWGIEWAKSVDIWELQSIINQKCPKNSDVWVRGWQWLSISSKNLYKNSSYIPKLINNLLSINKWKWDEEVTDSWVTILKRMSSQSKRLEYLQACADAVNFALNHEHYPVSEIIIETFLPIYKAIIQSESLPSEVYSIFSYLDWDKGKELRKRLVNSFMESRWPPGDLALSVADKTLLRKIYSRLNRQWKGKEYIQSIIRDLSQRKKDDVAMVLDEFIYLSKQHNFSERWD